MILGKRLRDLRKEKGFTQQELGDKIGLTKVSISGYENGLKTPTIPNLIDLADTLQTSITYLLGLDEYLVSESNNEYGIYVADEELLILRTLRNYPDLYKKMLNDPKRMIELIDKKLR